MESTENIVDCNSLYFKSGFSEVWQFHEQHISFLQPGPIGIPGKQGIQGLNGMKGFQVSP